jgi:hypothetical protein
MRINAWMLLSFVFVVVLVVDHLALLQAKHDLVITQLELNRVHQEDDVVLRECINIATKTEDKWLEAKADLLRTQFKLNLARHGYDQLPR